MIPESKYHETYMRIMRIRHNSNDDAIYPKYDMRKPLQRACFDRAIKTLSYEQIMIILSRIPPSFPIGPRYTWSLKYTPYAKHCEACKLPFYYISGKRCIHGDMCDRCACKCGAFFGPGLKLHTCSLSCQYDTYMFIISKRRDIDIGVCYCKRHKICKNSKCTNYACTRCFICYRTKNGKWFCTSYKCMRNHLFQK